MTKLDTEKARLNAHELLGQMWRCLTCKTKRQWGYAALPDDADHKALLRCDTCGVNTMHVYAGTMLVSEILASRYKFGGRTQ